MSVVRLSAPHAQGVHGDARDLPQQPLEEGRRGLSLRERTLGRGAQLRVVRRARSLAQLTLQLLLN